MSLAFDFRCVLAACALAVLPACAFAALQVMDDAELTDVSAQAGSLFLADKIGPNELTGPDPGGASNFSFYRVAMDVKMDMNMNIAKFQLGCGGVNDFLTGTGGCDFDIDYVSFMGINSAGDGPDINGPDSEFSLTRPYIEFAIKNDGTATREIVGIKIGAQKINGVMRLGRDYLGIGTLGQESNLVNQENNDPVPCNSGATSGSGVVACHSGVNSISGFLAGVELSAGVLARAYISALITISADINACLGRINFDPCSPTSTPFFVDAGGTRMQNLFVKAAPLNMKVTNVGGITLSGYGGLNLSLRQIHYLTASNASDFFISFQREPVSWPRYEKSPPNVPQGNPPTPPAITTVPTGNKNQESYYDSCNGQWGQVPQNGRCASAYTEPSNTGWWLNASTMRVLNLMPANRITIPGTLSLTQLISALGPDTSPIILDNPRIDMIAYRNCYGSQLFC